MTKTKQNDKKKKTKMIKRNNTNNGMLQERLPFQRAVGKLLESPAESNGVGNGSGAQGVCKAFSPV